MMTLAGFTASAFRPERRAAAAAAKTAGKASQQQLTGLLLAAVKELELRYFVFNPCHFVILSIMVIYSLSLNSSRAYVELGK